MKVGEPFSPKGLFTGLFVPGWLAQMRLPASAKLVYGRAANLDTGTGVVEFEQAWMSSEVGVDEKTVRASIRTLATESLWRVDRVAGVARLAHRSHRYVFLWHPAMTSAAMRRGVAIPGPGISPGPGREEAPPAGGQIARSNEVGEEGLGELPPPTPPRGGPEWPRAVDRKAVTASERDLADAILAEFNKQAGTGYSGAADHRRGIVGRLREHPRLDLAAHGRLIRAALADPWWKGPPGPQVIYGNAGVFEQAIERAKAARGATVTDVSRERHREERHAEIVAEVESSLEAARTPEAAQAAREVRERIVGRRVAS